VLLKISSLNFNQEWSTKAFSKVIPQEGQMQRESMRRNSKKKEKNNSVTRKGMGERKTIQHLCG